MALLLPRTAPVRAARALVKRLHEALLRDVTLSVSEGVEPRPLCGAVPYMLLATPTLLICFYTHAGRVGPTVLGTTDRSASALYVTNILFFTGAGAGAIVTCTLARALGLPGAMPLTRLADIAAIGSVMLALIFVLLDLARLDHLWPFVRSVHFAPADVTIIGIYLGNAVALSYFGTRLELVRSLARRRPGRGLHRVIALGRSAVFDAAPVARAGLPGEWLVILTPAMLLMQSIPAWIVVRLEERSLWQVTAIAASSYVSSVIVGLSLVVVAATLGRGIGRTQTDDEVVRRLGVMLVLAIPILGYCLFGEMDAVVLSNGPAAAHIFHELVAGPYAPFVWLDLGLGVVVPFALIALPARPMRRPVGLAALFVILGVCTGGGGGVEGGAERR